MTWITTITLIKQLFLCLEPFICQSVLARLNGFHSYAANNNKHGIAGVRLNS